MAFENFEHNRKPKDEITPPPQRFLFIILYNNSIQGKLNISFTLNSIGDKIRVGEISVTKRFSVFRYRYRPFLFN